MWVWVGFALRAASLRSLENRNGWNVCMESYMAVNPWVKWPQVFWSYWPLCLSFHITWGNAWGITHHPFALSPFTYSAHKQKGTLVFMNIRCLIHLRNFSQCSLCNKNPLEFWKMALQCKASALWDERWEKELHFGDVMMLTLRAADSPFPLKSSTKKKESDYNSLFHGTWQAQELLWHFHHSTWSNYVTGFFFVKQFANL